VIGADEILYALICFVAVFSLVCVVLSDRWTRRALKDFEAESKARELIRAAGHIELDRNDITKAEVLDYIARCKPPEGETK
jgi:hypothetical protein